MVKLFAQYAVAKEIMIPTMVDTRPIQKRFTPGTLFCSRQIYRYHMPISGWSLRACETIDGEIFSSWAISIIVECFICKRLHIKTYWHLYQRLFPLKWIVMVRPNSYISCLVVIYSGFWNSFIPNACNRKIVFTVQWLHNQSLANIIKW